MALDVTQNMADRGADSLKRGHKGCWLGVMEITMQRYEHSLGIGGTRERGRRRHVVNVAGKLGFK